MTQQEGAWTSPMLPAPTRALHDPGHSWAWLTELSEDRRRHVTVALRTGERQGLDSQHLSGSTVIPALRVTGRQRRHLTVSPSLDLGWEWGERASGGASTYFQDGGHWPKVCNLKVM